MQLLIAKMALKVLYFSIRDGSSSTLESESSEDVNKSHNEHISGTVNGIYNDDTNIRLGFPINRRGLYQSERKYYYVNDANDRSQNADHMTQQFVVYAVT